MTRFSKRILSAVLAAIMLLSMVPLSAMAAPASDLPDNMVDSPILRALEYTGYDVQKQKDDGTLYQSGSYGSRTPSDVLSNIHYGTSMSGKETIADSSTVTGKAPDIARFERNGLCCAAFVTYYVCNYLPNIEGADTQFILDAINATGMNSQAAVTWQTALNRLADAGSIEKIGTSSSNVDRTKLAPGDLIMFGNDETTHSHIAVYSGTYKGTDFLIHVGNDRGPEIMPVSWMSDSSNGAKASYPNAYYHLPENIIQEKGAIEIYKKDTDGKNLSGASFLATSTSDPGKQYVIGPTNSSGYAYVDDIPYDTYKIKETVFPTNYRSYGQTEWTVTIDKNTPNGTVTVNAVNEIIPGECEIVKTSEDGVVSGIEFTITGNGVNKTVKTDSSGKIATSLKPGVYQITEQSIDRYEPQKVHSVTVVSGQKATITVNNTLKRGSLSVSKSSEDGLVEGVRFRLYGTSFSGEKVDLYATTNKNGIAKFEDVLIGSKYTLEEVDTAIRYVVPDEQQAVIEWEEVTNYTFENILKKFRVDVFKVDGDLYYGSGNGQTPDMLSLEPSSDEMVDIYGWPYGETQGDATLEGAVYGLYQNGKLLDTYTTDKNGYFVTDYYVCGEGYYLREISSSQGYLLDPTEYYINCSADRYSIELNTEYVDVYEDIIKGQIGLVKHTDNGDTQIETPEVGAVFEVYLKSAGSYEAAKETERDILVIDKDGFALSKELPYGVFTVSQREGWEGRELLPDFDVAITQDGYVYRYIINNANFESYIKVIKTDATTGKTIPYAGAAFQIYDPEGNLVKMKYTYPQVTVIDTFYTTADGTLITPETLPYGKGYSLVEVQANYGYVLDSTPVYFDILQENSSQENDIVIVNVVKGNMPQMGTITITKSGEIFASVSEKDGVYQPVYKVAGLKGAVFSVYAAEDIYTPDGTLRYSKGEKVDTITTGSDGTATTKELHLGKFELREDKAPYGMLLNGESVFAELVYAGQEIKVTSTSTSMTNERQKIVLDLLKAMEQDETFKLGMNGEISKVSFGLYAAEILTAADGTEIPKDGLIEAVQCSADGKAVFTTDVPVGAKLYVKEIATDNSYILSGTAYPVEFVYAGQDVATVIITVNDGNTIENKIIRGSVEGLKLDEDGNAVKDVEFGLFWADTTDFSKENAILISTTDSEGKFGFENLPVQKWLIKELSCPEQYVLSDEVFTVEITEDGQVVHIEAENKFVVGNIEVTKTDSDTAEKLSGAVFEVYKDIDGDKVFNAEIDTLYGILDETETGVYLLEGLRYSGYFLHESESPENHLPNDEYYYFAITENGKTVTVETAEGKGFENEAFKGSIKIIKMDADTGELLSGVEFGLYDLDGNEIAKGVTDESGELIFDNIRYGKYELRELTQKDGYYKNEEVIAVEITEHGQVLTFEVTNKKIPEQPDTPDSPQTGDNSNIGLWFTIMCLSLLALIGLCVYNRKARNH